MITAVHRYIIEAALAAGLNRRDLIDDVHALGHLGEHRVAEIAARVVEKIIVLQIHKKLRRGAVDVVGARHRQGAALVLQAVIGLVLDRRLGLLLRHVFREPAALDDKARHDAVKNGAIEESVVDVAREIGDRFGRFLLEQFDGEVAQGGFEADHGNS